MATTNTTTRAEELARKRRALHDEREPILEEKRKLDKLRREAYRGSRTGDPTEDDRAFELADHLERLNRQIAAVGAEFREVRALADAEAAEAQRPEVAAQARAVLSAAEKLQEEVRRLHDLGRGLRRVGPLALSWPSAHALALRTFKTHARDLDLL